MTRLAVTLLVETDDPTHLPRVFEVLSRAAAGLLLDGIESHLIADQRADQEAETE